MAKLCGYSTAYIIKIENGESKPTIEMIEAVCTAFHVSKDWLISGEGTMLERMLKPMDNGWIERLKSLRAERQMSTRQFGKLIGVTNATVIRLERGDIQITQRRAKKIADACEVGVKWLLNGDENVKSYPCSDAMIAYLEKHMDVREYVWSKMKHDDDAAK